MQSHMTGLQQDVHDLHSMLTGHDARFERIGRLDLVEVA